MKDIRKLLIDILKQDPRFIIEGKLAKNKVIELALQLDTDLLKLLLSSSELTSTFFQKVDEFTIFDKVKFQSFISNKQFLPDSFTEYKNKIGLTANKEYLTESEEVVLDFPYKDCVLEGGQTKEDAKRNEVFWNETLAPDEIDRLLSHKVFTNWKQVSADGNKKVESFQRDEHGTIKDNLIIKGNNLLVLHSIKSEFVGKVKLIYIDPPYNTGGDANIFTYNNSFNHSTWLTFMKNRLEVGRELLRDDGFISIAIDHFELGYLLVLSDEIFGEENRLGIISVVNNPMGRNQAKYFSTINDFMIIYAKKNSSAKFNNVVLDETVLKTFNKEDEKGKYKLNKFIRIGGGDVNLRKNKKSFWYPLYVDKQLETITTEAREDYLEVYPITNSGQERTWKLSKPSAEKILNDLIAIKENEKIVIFEKYRLDKGQKVPTIWSDKKYNANHQGIRLLEKIIGNQNFSFPKSLYTVLDTLKLMTSDDDIILDFHAGSGTTGHATLALNKEDGGNRKFILIEQLDEHIKICTERNQKVLVQENIDESFISMELTQVNQSFIFQIQEAKNTKDLLKIRDKMKSTAFLSYKIRPEEIDASKKEFENLSFEDQQRFLVSLLDKNLLYVPYSEIDDETYNISKEDKKLNQQFYSNI